MQYVLLIFCAVMPLCSSAASVVWDYVDVETFASSDRNTIILTNYSKPYTALYLWYEEGYVGVDAMTASTPSTGTDYSRVCLAEKGDVVDSNHLTQSSKPLGGSELHPAYQYEQSPGTDFYIMFETGSIGDRDNPYYGWAELTVSPIGELSLAQIMVDLDHDAVVVGDGSPIPEPSTMTMLILGIASIGLKRKNRTLRA